MRDYIILAAIIGLVPFSLFRPFIGLLAWSWVSYMAPHKLGWGIAAHQPVALAIGGAALLGFVFSRESKRIPKHGALVIYFLFLFWMLLTFLVNEKSPEAIEQADKVAKIQLFTVISLMLVNSKERLLALLAVITASIGFFGVKGGIFTVVGGGSERVWGPSGTFIQGNNELGLAMLIAGPLMFYFAKIVERPWQRHALNASAALCFVAALGTHSRGALLAMIAVLSVMWWRSKHKLGILVGAAILIPVLFAVAPKSWTERMATMREVSTERAERPAPDLCAALTFKMQSEDASFGGRVNAWCMSLSLASHHFFGNGFLTFTEENFARYAPDPVDIHDAHSIYFKILGEHGFIGLALFFGILVSTFVIASRTRKLAQNRGDLLWSFELAGTLQASIMAYAIGGLFLGLCYFDLFYHLFVIAVVLETLTRQALAKPEGQAGVATASDDRRPFRFAGFSTGTRA